MADAREDRKESRERRRFERATVLWSATLAWADQETQCIIVNISTTGALVRVDGFAVGHSAVTIKSPRFGSLTGEVVWHENNELGVQFTIDPDEVARLVGDALH